MTFYQHEDVTWLHKPRGGYGYVIPVPARIVQVYRVKALIEARLEDGGTKAVLVPIASLRKVTA